MKEFSKLKSFEKQRIHMTIQAGFNLGLNEVQISKTLADIGVKISIKEVMKIYNGYVQEDLSKELRDSFLSEFSMHEAS